MFLVTIEQKILKLSEASQNYIGNIDYEEYKKLEQKYSSNYYSDIEAITPSWFQVQIDKILNLFK